jgi:hypothetical protein
MSVLRSRLNHIMNLLLNLHRTVQMYIVYYINNGNSSREVKEVSSPQIIQKKCFHTQRKHTIEIFFIHNLRILNFWSTYRMI